MATLILGTVGRVFGGPIGGLIGSIAGGLVDRSLFGGSGGGGRLGNLEVQSAAYGEPIPVITGRMRVAGNLIWSDGITETTSGGKGGGGYSYSASFAVALAAGPITAIGRIWADGTEIRSSAGSFASPVTMRLYKGDESQTVDPLIAAAEAGAAPAYRGIAYAVFEDLPLAEFGNRIPNLTFEVITGAAGPVDLGTVLHRLTMRDGRALAAVSGGFPAFDGHVAAKAGSIADNLMPIVAITGVAVASDAQLVLIGDSDTAIDLPAADGQAHDPDSGAGRDRQVRHGGDTVVAGIELGYFDTDRAYQAGLQRVQRSGPGMVARQAVAGAMPAALAKHLAARMLARREAARVQTSVRLPWRHAGLRPGMQVRLAGDSRIWRVRQTRFEAFVVHLDLERTDTIGVPGQSADAGRAAAFVSQPAGTTALQWLDLPPLPGEAASLPRLWLAAAGAAPGWRRAPLAVSLDDGFSYRDAGTVAGGGVQGIAMTALPPGPCSAWDRFSTVEVLLLADAMWLQPASEAAVLAGANLVLVGDELLQFSRVEMLAPRRFRLSGLLRGRQGSEAAVAGHAAGERFVLLDRAGLLAIDLPADSIGRTVRARALGSGDGDAEAVAARVGGRALAPLAPVHLRTSMAGGDLIVRWVRRSRSGFGWADFVDAPLAEASEAYRVELWRDGSILRDAAPTAPTFVYAAADRIADGGGTVELRVSQVSALVGPGPAAITTLILP